MGSGAGKKKKVYAPEVDTSRAVVLDDESEYVLSPQSQKTPGQKKEQWTSSGSGGDRKSSGLVVSGSGEEEKEEEEEGDIFSLYPAENFEITLYSYLEGLRPGNRIELSNFQDDAKDLSTLEGKCSRCDSANSCWTFILDDNREVRVFPLSVMPEQNSLIFNGNADKFKGRIIYHTGSAIHGQLGGVSYQPPAWVHPGWQTERKQFYKEALMQERLSSKKAADEAERIAKEKNVPRRKLQIRRSNSVGEVSLAGGMTIGEVVQTDDKWAGDAVVIGPGSNPDSVLIKFINDDKKVSIAASKVKRQKRPSQSGRSKSKESADSTGRSKSGGGTLKRRNTVDF